MGVMDLNTWLERMVSLNGITLLFILIVVGSIYQGMARGATGSARHLFSFLLEGALTVVAIAAAWRSASWLSPSVQQWLNDLNIRIPNETLNGAQQLYYTVVTAIRDFSLFRSGLLFLLAYISIKAALNFIVAILFHPLIQGQDMGNRSSLALLSRGAGGAIGCMIGFARALIATAVLFVVVTLFPHSSFADYAQSSAVYQRVATQWIQPFTGDFLSERAPVITRAVQTEFNHILQRKYEVIDYAIPQDIEGAAKEIVREAKTDRERAELLYDWVGSRIEYSDEKVRLYVEEQIWLEQTPDDTFRQRQGVCIDYARLYAMMARAAGLDVKVVTGLGYDGRGGYGPHAWNEVYLQESRTWIPLDSTWARAGNWFDPPNFYDTHVRDG